MKLSLRKFLRDKAADWTAKNPDWLLYTVADIGDGLPELEMVERGIDE